MVSTFEESFLEIMKAIELETTSKKEFRKWVRKLHNLKKKIKNKEEKL